MAILTSLIHRFEETLQSFFEDFQQPDEPARDCEKGNDEANRALEECREQNKHLKAIIASQAKKIAELQEAVMRDPLTDLLNRRGIEHVLHEKMKLLWRATRNGVPPFSVIVIDLDDFKETNDAHGHHVGDKVLVAVAQAMQECFWDTDILGRLGGDEFLVILPNTAIQNVAQPVNKLRKKLAELTLEGQHLEGLGVSASIGVAQLKEPADMDDHEQLWSAIKKTIKAADRAMYKSKESDGRNVISFAGHQ